MPVSTMSVYSRTPQVKLSSAKYKWRKGHKLANRLLTISVLMPIRPWIMSALKINPGMQAPLTTAQDLLYTPRVKKGYLTKNPSPKKCVAFTGAGVSQPSGLPTFEKHVLAHSSTGYQGIKYDPSTVLTLKNFMKDPMSVWRIASDFLRIKASPNDAHKGLAKLEKLNLLTSIITLNVDNLHQEAGSKTIHSIHGKLNKAKCMSCSTLVPLDKELVVTEQFRQGPAPKCPKCKHGLLKPNVLLLGEPAPPGYDKEAVKHVKEADLILYVGASGKTAKDRSYGNLVKNNGGQVIEINPNPTKVTKTLTDCWVPDSATTLKILADNIEKTVRAESLDSANNFKTYSNQRLHSIYTGQDMNSENGNFCKTVTSKQPNYTAHQQ